VPEDIANYKPAKARGGMIDMAKGRMIPKGGAATGEGRLEAFEDMKRRHGR
jgi:hypothetical protein